MPLVKPAWPILQRGDPLSVGLVSAWNLSEGAGSNASDGVGGARNQGTIHGTPSWVGSPWGSALSFDGSTQYVSTAVNSVVASQFTPFSICYSVYWPSNPAGLQEIVNARSGSGLSPGPFSQLRSDGQINFGEYDGASFPEVVTAGLTPGNWYHVVCTSTGINGTSADYAIYINGAPNYSILFGGAVSLVASYPWNIGWDNGTATKLNGKVGHLYVWNRALSAAEAAQLYFDPFSMFRPKRRLYVLPDTVIGKGRLPKPAWPILQRGDLLAQGLVGAWPFYEGSGDTLHDLTAYRNNATATNGSAAWSNGPFGVLGKFAGSAFTYYLVPRAPSLDLDDFTAVIGVSYTANNTNSALLAKWTAGADQDFILWFQNSTDINFGGSSSNTTVWSGGQTATNDGEPHVLVVTRSGTTATIYSDGAAKASNTAAGNARSGSFSADFNIANYSNNAFSGGFSGQVHFVLLYNRALTAVEIAQLYFDAFSIYRPERRVPWFTVSGTPVGAASFIPHSRRSKLNIIPIQLYR